ncbi:cyclic nucleotide-binding domain-containing protein [Ancylobacter sp. A5.8]|uniref:cyclic nucleotide-binding domain-containing protein n=1 Tax=Ancylobacter gelatini TaxID=2919920 RepID=UPI001F4DAE18|nr:cyclic nucleotide-binding domain-containing protein [Ancylobacter gelatini]MCJ8144411.1 cyclic nucleotide-binding domain-containing protein [Ancylobacter gelatini]
MPIDDDIALLERVPMLQLLGREGLRAIAISADSRSLAEGEVLFREGQFAESAFVVTAGSFSVSRDEPGHSRRGARQVAGPGVLLGDIALITETKRGTTAIALETSTVLRISRVIFMRTVESYPEAAARLAAALRDQVSNMLGELDMVRLHLEAIEPPARPSARR